MTITKRFAIVAGLAFLLLGLLGFIEPLAPDGMLFGVFAVNTAHNVFHIVTGLLGLWAGSTRTDYAGLGYTWYVLLTYTVLSILGFVLAPDEGLLLGIFRANMADHWLHLVIALSALGVLLAAQQRPVYR